MLKKLSKLKKKLLVFRNQLSRRKKVSLVNFPAVNKPLWSTASYNMESEHAFRKSQVISASMNCASLSNHGNSSSPCLDKGKLPEKEGWDGETGIICMHILVSTAAKSLHAYQAKKEKKAGKSVPFHSETITAHTNLERKHC